MPIRKERGERRDQKSCQKHNTADITMNQYAGHASV